MEDIELEKKIIENMRKLNENMELKQKVENNIDNIDNRIKQLINKDKRILENDDMDAILKLFNQNQLLRWDAYYDNLTIIKQREEIEELKNENRMLKDNILKLNFKEDSSKEETEQYKVFLQKYLEDRSER